MVFTTYPLIGERPVTRAEIDRLTAIIARLNDALDAAAEKIRILDYEYNLLLAWDTKGHEALLMLNRAGYAGSEYTGPGGLLLAVKSALANAETTRRIKEKAVARLNVSLDSRANTIRDLCHTVELERARAEGGLW